MQHLVNGLPPVGVNGLPPGGGNYIVQGGYLPAAVIPSQHSMIQPNYQGTHVLTNGTIEHFNGAISAGRQEQSNVLANRDSQLALVSNLLKSVVSATSNNLNQGNISSVNACNNMHNLQSTLQLNPPQQAGEVSSSPLSIPGLNVNIPPPGMFNEGTYNMIPGLGIPNTKVPPPVILNSSICVNNGSKSYGLQSNGLQSFAVQSHNIKHMQGFIQTHESQEQPPHKKSRITLLPTPCPSSTTVISVPRVLGKAGQENGTIRSRRDSCNSLDSKESGHSNGVNDNLEAIIAAINSRGSLQAVHREEYDPANPTDEEAKKNDRFAQKDVPGFNPPGFNPQQPPPQIGQKRPYSVMTGDSIVPGTSSQQSSPFTNNSSRWLSGLGDNSGKNGMMSTQTNVTSFHSIQMTNQTSSFHCQVCNVTCLDVKTFEIHMQSNQHSSRASGQILTTDALISRFKTTDFTKTADTTSSEPFCKICNRRYSGTLLNHQKGPEHKRKDRLTKRGCVLCQTGPYTTYPEYVKHIDSIEHKKQKDDLQSEMKERESLGIAVNPAFISKPGPIKASQIVQDVLQRSTVPALSLQESGITFHPPKSISSTPMSKASPTSAQNLPTSATSMGYSSQAVSPLVQTTRYVQPISTPGLAAIAKTYGGNFTSSKSSLHPYGHGIVHLTSPGPNAVNQMSFTSSPSSTIKGYMTTFAETNNVTSITGGSGNMFQQTLSQNVRSHSPVNALSRDRKMNYDKYKRDSRSNSSERGCYKANLSTARKYNTSRSSNFSEKEYQRSRYNDSSPVKQSFDEKTDSSSRKVLESDSQKLAGNCYNEVETFPDVMDKLITVDTVGTCDDEDDETPPGYSSNQSNDTNKNANTIDNETNQLDDVVCTGSIKDKNDIGQNKKEKSTDCTSNPSMQVVPKVSNGDSKQVEHKTCSIAGDDNTMMNSDCPEGDITAQTTGVGAAVPAVDSVLQSKVCEDGNDGHEPGDQQFVVPVCGYYCSLCDVFYLDKDSPHCTSQRHVDMLMKQQNRGSTEPREKSLSSITNWIHTQLDSKKPNEIKNNLDSNTMSDDDKNKHLVLNANDIDSIVDYSSSIANDNNSIVDEPNSQVTKRDDENTVPDGGDLGTKVHTLVSQPSDLSPGVNYGLSDISTSLNVDHTEIQDKHSQHTDCNKNVST